jgi:hypothetical protein
MNETTLSRSNSAPNNVQLASEIMNNLFDIIHSVLACALIIYSISIRTKGKAHPSLFYISAIINVDKSGVSSYIDRTSNCAD